MDKKAITLALIEIFKDTDENNPLTREQIEKKLINTYNISVDRRTIYSNILLLKDFDYDISTPSDNGTNTYYLNGRTFEPSEINLLCNSIHSSRFIPVNYSKDLIKKLLSTQSKSFRKEYNDEVFVDNGNKKENKDFFLNIDIITDAISKKVNISFDYMKYDINFKLVKKDEERRTISPHHIIYTNDKVYLTGYSEHRKMIIHYRVDKMMNIAEEKGKYIAESKKSDPYQYARTKMYMYAGEDISVTIRFKETILDDIIDSFGKNISIVEDGKGYYKTTVKTSETGIIYYALQYLNNLQVLEPKNIKNKIKESLMEGLKLYK